MKTCRDEVGHWVEGASHGVDLRIGIVVARFNGLVGDRLLDGALGTLRRFGVRLGDVTVVWVPGAFEIPLAAQRLASLGHVDAVVCLGAVIRGSTPHFDYVAGPCAQAILHVGLETRVPVVFGVLTCDTMEQAVDRAGGKAGNKGSDAAMAAIETAHVHKELLNKMV